VIAAAAAAAAAAVVGSSARALRWLGVQEAAVENPKGVVEAVRGEQEAFLVLPACVRGGSLFIVDVADVADTDAVVVVDVDVRG